jgi:small subunit ribosomal protein S5
VDLLDTKRSAADALSATYGPLAADILREQQANKAPLSVGDELDEQLRWADYLLAEQGSTEDLVGERRALSQLHNRDDFLDDLHSAISAERINNLDLNETDFAPKPLKRASAMAQWVDEDDTDRAGGGDDDDPETVLDKNQLAHGDWSEMLVKVDRNIKLWRGGRLESYRALIVGGNMNGCGGFGFGKSTDPLRAVDLASRHCKRNIFFVDRYQNNGITRDLAGKQNSCVVTIRATDNGLRGNALVSEILKRFGIVNAVAKSHGNRNPYNVVRATFKALMTHESLEDIALKRGKRLVSVDRARRMQV